MDSLLVFGLGNPGPEYAFTRHNIGFMVLDRMQNGLPAEPFAIDRFAWRTEGTWKGDKLILIKPSTFMNLSGQAVRYWMQKEGIPAERIIVITDDIALPFGQLRLRTKGSGGGHNGLGNIQTILGTDAYPRLRFGVGANFGRGQQANYVLSNFDMEEQKDLPTHIERAAETILSIPKAGLDRAMEAANKRIEKS